MNETANWEAIEGTWLSHGDPVASVMMQVPNVGAFVRSLLPVHLTDGYMVTFGVWLAIHPDDLQRIFSVWWEPAYRELVVDGWLANALPAWGLLAAPVNAAVRDADQTPYVAASSDPRLEEVLTREWPHDQVLGALP